MLEFAVNLGRDSDRGLPLPQHYRNDSMVVGSRGSIMKFGGFGSCVGWALCQLVVLASAAAAYDVSYEYYINAQGGGGIPLMGEDTLTGETYVDGDYIMYGDNGTYGTAVFYANLLSATVSSQAYALGTQTGPYITNISTSTGRVERIWFRDGLIYTVAAGYYADGVQVSIGGRARGTIVSEVGAGSHVQCRVDFSTEVFDTGLLGVGVDDEGTLQVNEDFLLTVQLLFPGSTLSSPREFNLPLTAGIFNGQTWAVAYNTGSGYVTGAGGFDFTDGLEITYFLVPSGVTWTSESGAFPHLPTSVQDGTPLRQMPRLLQNHPNPFNPQTTISFDLPRPAAVSLRVFDVSGRLVRALLEGEVVAEGRQEVVWDGRDDGGRRVGSGTYFYRLESGEYAEIRRHFVSSRLRKG